MSDRIKENPLLFSANAASPFDDISAAAVLMPPQQLLPSKPISNDITNEKGENKESLNGAGKSLQPHLHKEPPHTLASVSSSTKTLFSTQDVPNLLAGPPPIPKLEGNLNSVMRKPLSKYVVPPEMSKNTNFPSFSPSPQSSFIPSHLIPPPRPPSFIPPTNTFIPPTNTFIPPPPPVSSFVPTINESSNSPALFPVMQPDHSSSPSPIPSFESQSTIIPASFDNIASSPPSQGEVYHPVIPHWFYCEGKPAVWKPFSFTDSLILEAVYLQKSGEKVACDGGRYDVNIEERKRVPVYWEDEPGDIRRCSWFRKNYSDALPVPYDEDVCEKLENEYREAMTTGRWHRQLELPGGERVMINSPYSMHHYQVQTPDAVNLTAGPHPQTVKRGADDFEMKEGTSEKVDHLLFLIHGIGSVCDLSFRSVEECVNDFRSMGEDLIGGHFKESVESGAVGRVEILPISWHKALHGDATGLDEKLKQITLRSIPKFREFTNDTLLDILYYTSPVYCQHIMDTVSSEMDRLLSLFRQRNPAFSGGISLGGHSLGSVILFDLLMHQNPQSEMGSLSQNGADPAAENSGALSTDSSQEKSSEETGGRSSLTSKVNFEFGVAGTGQPAIVYPQLSFQPQILFLMGSPVAMFITVRGIDKLGPDFKLPTCSRVFNIFHPFDPVAYRIETLIDPTLLDLRPVLIPHHKGRKRMHLELKDTIERVGSDLKNKIVESIQSTWNKFYQIYAGGQNETLRAQLDDAVAEKMQKLNLESEPSTRIHSNVVAGQLNGGERVDYVLQEKPYESFTEYIFALQAHVSYWNSEDTLLMMLKEVYKLSGIRCDSVSKPAAPLMHSGDDASSGIPTLSPSATFSESLNNLDTLENSTPPVPLFCPPVSASASPSQPSGVPKSLRGRPMFDPLKSQPTTGGMDPTATPTARESLPPPPIVPNINFSQKNL